MGKDITKIIAKMMASLPPNSEIPSYIIVGDTAFHPGLIEYQQKEYRKMELLVFNMEKEVICANLRCKQLDEYIHNIRTLNLLGRFMFFITGRLPSPQDHGADHDHR